jgi:CRISPR-associated protein Cmr3
MNVYQVDPVDVLMLRGNRSFGDGGEHGEVSMPPWPSVFAGAFRAALLGQDANLLAAYSRHAGDSNRPVRERSAAIREAIGERLFDVLGTPDAPGSFRLAWLSLARHGGPVMPLPADLLAFRSGEELRTVPLTPAEIPGASGPLPLRAVPRLEAQQKPAGGAWLDAAGVQAHLAGMAPATVMPTSRLFAAETRLGIGIDPTARTAADGALYTTEAVSFAAGSGFLVGIEGMEGAALPDEGVLRLGGDGRAARYRRVDAALPAPAPVAGRFRLVMATPAVFAGGWIPDGVAADADGHYRLKGDGFSARLVCAAVPRNAVVSGWDIARWIPKTAQRVVPAGSVYWFDGFEGDHRKLATWVAGGVWGDNADRQRRAEGFNLALLGEWR